MITIDCPLCAGQAATDAALSAVTCADCGITVDIAADPAAPAAPALDLAA